MKFGLEILSGFEKLQFLYVLLRSYLIRSYSKSYHSLNKRLSLNKWEFGDPTYSVPLGRFLQELDLTNIDFWIFNWQFLFYLVFTVNDFANFCFSIINISVPPSKIMAENAFFLLFSSLAPISFLWHLPSLKLGGQIKGKDTMQPLPWFGILNQFLWKEVYNQEY